MYKLVIQDDEGKTTVVPLIRDELTIGRKEGNTIRLTERNVSRRHARVVRKNGVIEIEDLDSYNGIRVNGSRIQGKVDLKESDRVQIGDYLIEIKTEAAEKDSSNDATQPIERVDPMGNTPVPEVAQGTMPGTRPPSEIESAATAPVAAAPEVPLSASDAELPQVAPAAGQVGHARLVVLSTNYAGREFELDKPAMVIGRTDDNDIWLNHRSISRHHAKIVRENGRYAIVDLQSSNGVRVNGEEYGKVELRRADVVDLGHVRMRFVEPGEDFVFGRDAQAIDIEPEGGSRMAIWAVLALLLLGGGVAVFMMMRGDDDSGDNSTEAAPVGQKGDTDDSVKLLQSDAGVDIDDTSNDEVAELLDKARELINAEDWAAAHAAAGEAVAIEPANETAKRLREQAKSELDASLTYETLTECKTIDVECVKNAFDLLPAASVYRDKARGKLDKARDDYIKQKKREAQAWARKKRCDKVREIVRAVDKLFPEHSDKVSVSCTEEVLAASDNTNTTANSTKTNNPVVTAPPDEPKKDDKKDNKEEKYKQYIADAKAAAKASQFGRALRLCEKALAIKRTTDANMVCGIASCNLGSKGKAKKYIARIRGSGRQQMVRQICLRNGLKLD